MTGWHEVRQFWYPTAGAPGTDKTLSLPEGWKPFSAVKQPFGWSVLARRWVRDETFLVPKGTRVIDSSKGGS